MTDNLTTLSMNNDIHHDDIQSKDTQQIVTHPKNTQNNDILLNEDQNDDIHDSA
jgi:hypothetical protein